jgi:hypothetical protein
LMIRADDGVKQPTSKSVNFGGEFISYSFIPVLTQNASG